MNYEDAQALLEKYRHLEKTVFNGREITHLIVIPTDKLAFVKVLDAINLGMNHELVNKTYSDFKVVALMDYDDYHLTLRVSTLSLEDILHKE